MTNDNLAENAELMPQMDDQEWFHRTEPRKSDGDKIMDWIVVALVSCTAWTLLRWAAIEIWFRLHR